MQLFQNKYIFLAIFLRFQITVMSEGESPDIIRSENWLRVVSLTSKTKNDRLKRSFMRSQSVITLCKWTREKKKPSTLFDEKMLLHFKILTVINFRWQFLHTVLNSSIKVLIYLVLTLFRYLPEMILLACNIYFDKRYSWVLVRHLPTNSKYFDLILPTSDSSQ